MRIEPFSLLAFKNMMKTIFFVRHGETLFNLEKRLQGWNDSPLSHYGKLHAQAVAEVIAGFDIHQAWISPLGRAQETAAIIHARAGVPLETDSNLKEVSFGDFEGKTLPEIEVNFPGMWADRMADKWNYCPPNGESNKDAVPRARSIADKIEAYPASSVLVIAHFAINRIIISLLAGVDAVDTVQMDVPHGVIYKTEKSNGVWKVSYLDTKLLGEGFKDGWLCQEDPTKPMGG